MKNLMEKIFLIQSYYAEHGLLSAVIEYYTPYKYSDGSVFTLTLALGVDMAVNSILTLPAIIEG